MDELSKIGEKKMFPKFSGEKMRKWFDYDEIGLFLKQKKRCEWIDRERWGKNERKASQQMSFFIK